MEEKREKETAGQPEQNDLMVKLSRPYLFEGNEYREVDLSGLEQLTADDMIRAQRMLGRSGGTTALPETDYGYCMYLAATAAKLPVEFFGSLPAREAVKVKNQVSLFLLSEG